MPTVFIETFGCQMNVADSNMLQELLEARGFVPVEESRSADLVVVNTCSVREHAEKRAQSRISQYVQIKKKAKQKQAIWVVGCMAQRMGEKLQEQIPGIDRVIGAEKVEFLSHDLDRYLAESFSSGGAGDEGATYGPTAFLPVMRGCNNFCSYCIVPFVRGREHSMAAPELVDWARRMVDGGVREITLLGQNVNSYDDGETDFADLLGKIHDIEGLLRLRFTTSHPKDLSDKVIRTLADLPKACKHIHLPVQSGSSEVLGRMNRHYTRDEYLGLVDRIRVQIPDVDLTTDVMVGFPGETEQHFEETLSLFEKVRYTTAFMFAFSEREGTKAATMKDQVPVSDRKRRLDQLIRIQTEITKQQYQAMVGHTVEALFTQRQERRDRAWMGQDNGAKRVLLHCDEDLTGTILKCKVIRSSGMTLVAEREL